MVIIGAGFIGSELASTCRTLGLSVTVLSPQPMLADESLHHGDTVAAGDVVNWPHPALGGRLLRLEHWTNATEQARAAARRLARGPGSEPFAPVPSFWSDQFGIRIQGIGLPALADDVTVVSGDAAGDEFVAEYRRADELVGAVSVGSPASLLPYRRELAVRLLSALPV